MSHMKEQNKTQKKKKKKELNKIETSNLLGSLVIGMFNELWGRVDEFSNNLNKEIGNMKSTSQK